jgi:hypothetical protein
MRVAKQCRPFRQIVTEGYNRLLVNWQALDGRYSIPRSPRR